MTPGQRKPKADVWSQEKLGKGACQRASGGQACLGAWLGNAEKKSIKAKGRNPGVGGTAKMGGIGQGS